MNLVLQLLVVLVVLGYFAAFYVAARNFRWFYLTSLGFVFLMTLVFVVHVAMVLKTRKAWGEAVKSLEKQIAPIRADRERLLVGDETTAKDPVGTHPAARASVERTLIGRGRVWRGCIKVSADPMRGLIVLQTQGAAATAPPPIDPTAPPVAAPPAEPPVPSISDKAVLYAFAEGQITITKEGQPPFTVNVPELYMGEYETVGVNGNSVTLKPTLPLDPQQIQIVVAGTATWSLYEKMPTDSHIAFDEAFAADKIERNEAKIAEMIKRLPGTSDLAYTRAIQDFLRDGKAPQADDPTERIWFKVKFKKTFEVPVDSPNTQVRLDSEFFDLNGLAVLPGLRREEPVKFNKDDFAIINQAWADELSNEDVVEKVEAIYRRPLQDFKHHFHEIFHREQHLIDRLAELQRQLTSVAESQRKVQIQIDYRTIEKSKLEQDLAKHQTELAAVTEYGQKLEKAVAEVRARANELFQSNIELADELAALQAQMAEEINRRSLQAQGQQQGN